MTHSAPSWMHEPAQPDGQQRYRDALERAMRHAVRHVAWDQAFEVAHDVANEMLRRPEDEVTGALIYRSVINRLRNLWRATQRRATAEQVYQDERVAAATARVDPIGQLEARELRRVIERTLAAMPDGMRETFALIRDDELSYKEAAARLGVAVGTVHTQLSRANALLRQAIEDYQRGDAPASTAIGGRSR